MSYYASNNDLDYVVQHELFFVVVIFVGLSVNPETIRLAL